MRKPLSRLLSLALVAMLALSLSVPALAAEDGTVPWSNLSFNGSNVSNVRADTSGGIGSAARIGEQVLTICTQDMFCPEDGQTTGYVLTLSQAGADPAAGTVVYGPVCSLENKLLRSLFVFQNSFYFVASSYAEQPHWPYYELKRLDPETREVRSVAIFMDLPDTPLGYLSGEPRLLGPTEDAVYFFGASAYGDVVNPLYILNSAGTVSTLELPFTPYTGYRSTLVGRRGIYAAALHTSDINGEQKSELALELYSFDGQLLERLPLDTSVCQPRALLRETENFLYFNGWDNMRSVKYFRMDLESGALTDINDLVWEASGLYSRIQSATGESADKPSPLRYTNIAYDFGPGCVYVCVTWPDGATAAVYRVDEADDSVSLVAAGPLSARPDPETVVEGVTVLHPSVFELYALDQEQFMVLISGLDDSGSRRNYWQTLTADDSLAADELLRR